MLTKDLLRVSRAGGGYRPQFADADQRDLAARVLGVFQGHVDHPRSELDDALESLERDADDFKLVRGFASLVERDATFETRAAVPPHRARRAAFSAGEALGVVTETEREQALDRAASSLGVGSDAVADALYADLDRRAVLTAVDPRWGPRELLDQYNLSLAMTSCFDATEVRVRSTDPRAVISAVKRLRLMYEVRKSADGQRTVVVTGPDRLFRSTRRYGTRFARLLRSVAATADWSLEATIDDRGTERTMRLSVDDPVAVPDAEPTTDVSFDSGVEADFATRFESLDLDWDLVREPAPLAAGDRVMIPDFAFEYRHADFRIFFEIMGFWTPEYVAKKLDQLDAVDDVELLVAVDESLGVGEEITVRDHRAVEYAGTVRIKDVRDALRRYEADLVAESAADLPAELRPDAAVRTLAELAAERGVSERALDGVDFPDHERVGRTLVSQSVLDDLAAELEPGMALAEARDRFEAHGIAEDSAVLSALGYAVEWEGLGGGTIRRSE